MMETNSHKSFFLVSHESITVGIWIMAILNWNLHYSDWCYQITVMLAHDDDDDIRNDDYMVLFVLYFFCYFLQLVNVSFMLTLEFRCLPVLGWGVLCIRTLPNRERIRAMCYNVIVYFVMCTLECCIVCE